MITVVFNKTVKYNSIMYPPNTNFKATPEDIAALREAGAFVIEERSTSKRKEVVIESAKEDNNAVVGINGAIDLKVDEAPTSKRRK